MNLTLEPGGHACLLFRNANEQKQTVLPFLLEGLTGGEHCLFVCPEDATDDWLLEFQAFGIDVDTYLKTGGLLMATGEQWRQTPLNSIVKARDLWEHIEARLAGFPAVRIIGDAIWAQIEPPVSSGQLCHWEATANLLYQDTQVRTICMYDLNLHPPSNVRAALRTHPTVVLGEGAVANPHFEGQRILDNEPHLNDSPADSPLIEKLLTTLETSIKT